MKERRSSRATEDVALSLMGGSSVVFFLALLAFLVMLMVRPRVGDPSTYWAIALMAFLLITALVIVVVRGVRGLKRLNASAKEDRRRIAAGLPLERDDPQPPETPPGSAGKTSSE